MRLLTVSSLGILSSDFSCVTHHVEFLRVFPLPSLSLNTLIRSVTSTGFPVPYLHRMGRIKALRHTGNYHVTIFSKSQIPINHAEVTCVGRLIYIERDVRCQGCLNPWEHMQHHCHFWSRLLTYWIMLLTYSLVCWGLTVGGCSTSSNFFMVGRG